MARAKGAPKKPNSRKYDANKSYNSNYNKRRRLKRALDKAYKAMQNGDRSITRGMIDKLKTAIEKSYVKSNATGERRSQGDIEKSLQQGGAIGERIKFEMKFNGIDRRGEARASYYRDQWLRAGRGQVSMIDRNIQTLMYGSTVGLWNKPGVSWEQRDQIIIDHFNELANQQYGTQGDDIITTLEEAYEFFKEDKAEYLSDLENEGEPHKDYPTRAMISLVDIYARS